MNKEKKNKAVNLRMSKRQNRLILQMSRKVGISKGEFIRQRLFGATASGVIDGATEPDHTPDEIEADKAIIIEQLEYINKIILINTPRLPLAQRESVLNKLAELRSLLNI